MRRCFSETELGVRKAFFESLATADLQQQQQQQQQQQNDDNFDFLDDDDEEFDFLGSSAHNFCQLQKKMNGNDNEIVDGGTEHHGMSSKFLLSQQPRAMSHGSTTLQQKTSVVRLAMMMSAVKKLSKQQQQRKNQNNNKAGELLCGTPDSTKVKPRRYQPNTKATTQQGSAVLRRHRNFVKRDSETSNLMSVLSWDDESDLDIDLSSENSDLELNNVNSTNQFLDCDDSHDRKLKEAMMHLRISKWLHK